MADEGETKRSSGDSISALPDVILQHILSLIPTKFAIRTSSLSKRWRHVWLDTPSLSFDTYTLRAESINKTLTRYTARKMMTFQLCTSLSDNIPYIDKWIEFAMSRNVENLTLDFDFPSSDTYNMPDFFYVNSSVKQLSVELHSSPIVPICSVAWTSLKRLSLRSCTLSDESTAAILAGCPILESLTLYLWHQPESLTLYLCHQPKVLDLSKSHSLRTLEIDSNDWTLQIVAPHIHYLRLTNFKLPCTLVDVSSLTEANIEIGFNPYETLFPLMSCHIVMLLAMLDKLQNVEKLTFGENFFQILSLLDDQLLRAPFPSVKVKDLTVEIVISPFVIFGIAKVLKNSPLLKTLRVHTMDSGTLRIPMPIPIRNTKIESKHVVSFMKNILKRPAKTLEKVVVRLAGCLHDGRGFEELLHMLSHEHNNVSFVLN